MNEFVTWEMLVNYSTLVTIVFMVVEFTKNLRIFNILPTKYYSAIISIILIVLTHLQAGTFELWDIVLYVLSGIVISLSANGLSDFNRELK